MTARELVATFLAFFEGHPWAWAPFVLVVWYVGSGLALAVIDRALPHTDEGWAMWFAEAPRRAAAASLVKSWGWDLPKGVRAIRSLLRGPPPPALLERPRTAADLHAIAIGSVFPPARPPLASGDNFDSARLPSSPPPPKPPETEP